MDKKKKKSKKKSKPVYMMPVVISIIVLGVALVACTIWQLSQDEKSKPLGPVKILLVGNNLLVTNDVPNILRQVFQIAKTKRGVDIQSIAIPDAKYDLGKHLGSPELAKLSNSKWDLIILQDSAQTILESPYELLSNLRKIREKFKKASPKTRYVFVSPYVEKSDATKQQVISAVSRKMCKNLSMQIAPVGEVFSLTQENYPDLAIYTESNNSANSTGSFIIASTIFSTLSDKKLRGRASDFTYTYGKETKPMVSFSGDQYEAIKLLIDRCVRKRNGTVKVGLKTLNGLNINSK